MLYSCISNGEYPAHQKLPPENTLCQEFGISRPVLRAALDRLRDKGINQYTFTDAGRRFG